VRNLTLEGRMTDRPSSKEEELRWIGGKGDHAIKS